MTVENELKALSKKLPAEIEKMVLDLRSENPPVGIVRILDILKKHNIKIGLRRLKKICSQSSKPKYTPVPQAIVKVGTPTRHTQQSLPENLMFDPNLMGSVSERKED